MYSFSYFLVSILTSDTLSYTRFQLNLSRAGQEPICLASSETQERNGVRHYMNYYPVYEAGISCYVQERWEHNAHWYVFCTLKKCCEKYLTTIWTPVWAVLVLAVAGSNEWYVEWSANTCVQDCIGPFTTCVGLLKGSWIETFSTTQACCDAKLWY